MKKIFKSLAFFACCAFISSCVTISKPIAATSNPFGTKCGEVKSTVWFGLWDSKGSQNGIDQAAKKAGITKISHVDSYSKHILFGIVQQQVTKVYGE